MCDMVRNDGVTWNAMWLKIMSEMAFDVERCDVKCGGNDSVERCEVQWQCVIHSTSHHHNSTIFHIKHISSTAHHTTSHTWWCAVMQDVKCGCGIPSDVEWFDAILDMV